MLDASQNESDLHIFCPQKYNNGTLFQENFVGNVAAFYVFKWRHSEVIVVKLTPAAPNKISHKMYIFDIWKN